MKTLIIGGGMSGLVSAVLLSVAGKQVTIVERNSRVGKKIVMSGNGKCNFCNTNVSLSNYNKSSVANAVLSRISVQTYLDFMRAVGVEYFADEQGRVYPITETSATVLDCLRLTAENNGVKTITDVELMSVVKAENGFLASINGSKYLFDEVILACGSPSQAQSPNVYGIVPQSYFTTLVPSLTPVKVAEPAKSLAGVRAKAKVTLLCDGKPLKTDQGEVQFKESGLSGICIFNLSAEIARKTVLGEKHNYQFVLDFFPNLSLQELTEMLVARIRKFGIAKMFCGLLHNKIAEEVVKRTDSLGEVITADYASTAKQFTFDFDRLVDFSMSQVTSGGIDEKFVDAQTLTLPNGVRAVGEVLNVDGECGGYNMFFAGASAMCLLSETELASAILWLKNN